MPRTDGRPRKFKDSAILAALAGGMSNLEIAAHVSASKSTVDKRLKRLYRDNNVRTRTELAVKWAKGEVLCRL